MDKKQEDYKLFDAVYTAELYQDEDTVHQYDGDSVAGNNLSKICSSNWKIFVK